MSKPAEVRIIPCGACGGDGGHNGFDDVWERCNLCSGEGELEYDVEPVGLEDFQKANEEAAVSKVEFLIENLVQAAAEYENNCDRLVAKAIRIQLENAKQAIRDAIIPAPAQRPRKQPSTPLPWKFSPWHIEEGPPVVRAPAGYIVCTTASDQDAEYIAEACNAYAAQPPSAPVETDDLVEVVIACCNGQMGREAAIEVISELDLAGFKIVPAHSRSSAATGDDHCPTCDLTHEEHEKIIHKWCKNPFHQRAADVGKQRIRKFVVCGDCGLEEHCGERCPNAEISGQEG